MGYTERSTTEVPGQFFVPLSYQLDNQPAGNREMTAEYFVLDCRLVAINFYLPLSRGMVFFFTKKEQSDIST